MNQSDRTNEGGEFLFWFGQFVFGKIKSNIKHHNCNCLGGWVCGWVGGGVGTRLEKIGERESLVNWHKAGLFCDHEWLDFKFWLGVG